MELYKAGITRSLDKKTNKKVLESLKPKLLSSSINTKFHEATMIITKDGKTMYFTRDNYDGRKVRREKKQRKVNLKIYRAEWKEQKWTNITELPFNSDDYSIGHPALGADEKTLYFVSNMPGGIGATDLYKVTINEDKSFGIP